MFIPDLGCRIPYPGSRIPDPGSRGKKIGSRIRICNPAYLLSRLYFTCEMFGYKMTLGEDLYNKNMLLCQVIEEYILL